MRGNRVACVCLALITTSGVVRSANAQTPIISLQPIPAPPNSPLNAKYFALTGKSFDVLTGTGNGHAVASSIKNVLVTLVKSQDGKSAALFIGYEIYNHSQVDNQYGSSKAPYDVGLADSNGKGLQGAKFDWYRHSCGGYRPRVDGEGIPVNSFDNAASARLVLGGARDARPC